MNRPSKAATAVLAGVTATALAAAACSSSPSSSSSSSSSPSSSTSQKSALVASAPGITPSTITIGSHQPLTGVAAPGYDEIAPASNAYFAYLNAHGGIQGRKVVYKYLNDQYDPTLTSSVVRQLVLQDNVYAIFNGLGTPTHLAVAPFINANKVPDVFVASGCDCWNAPSMWPYTFGWQIDYIREGKLLGQFIEQHFKGKKVGIFYQGDEFGQDGLKGLSFEIPKSQIVAQEAYSPSNTNVGPQVAALKAAGAQVVAAYSVPAFTALLRLQELGLNYNPTMVVSSVGTDPITLGGLLQAFAKQGHATIPATNTLIQGIYTNAYLPSLGNASNSWIALFKKIHDTYIPKLPFDGNVLYGEAVAYTFTQAMFKAGRNPTRQDLVNAINGGLSQGPSVSPYLYSKTDHNGMEGSYMAQIQNGVITAIGPVEVTDTSATGPVTTFSGTQSAAPSSGIPSP